MKNRWLGGGPKPIPTPSEEPVDPNTVRIAGKIYRTTTIGNQVWLAQNLDAELGILGVDCLMYRDKPEMRAKYGLLYKFPILCSGKDEMSKELCAILPDGWRLPTHGDWLKLYHTLGNEGPGAKLKAKNGWRDDGNGTDDYGFSALPGGGVYDDADYYDCWCEGTKAYFWSSTLNGSIQYVWLWQLFGNSDAMWYGNLETQSEAHSVRLVKDVD